MKIYNILLKKINTNDIHKNSLALDSYTSWL